MDVRVGFDPAFNPGSGSRPQLPEDSILALVDTGATISCIDTSLVARLNLPFVDEQPFGGMAGSSVRPMHLAQIRVPALNFNLYGRFAAVDLLGGNQPHIVLLGRTFLHRFRMVYEGRTGSVVIENESAIVEPES